MKLFYLVIKAWVWLSLRLFYHEIQVYGKENIPKDAAVIFISNHFNTLLDPLLIVSSIQKKVWFLTRADVFKKSMAQKLLNFLGAMPAFRPVDGFKAPLKNQESFERCDKILQAGGAIALFPEGTHFQHRKLRSFKKGVFRIWKNNTEALVVPVGLNFSSLDTSKAKVSICFGTPIPYQENLNPDNLKEALAQQLYLPENPENCDTFLNQAWSQQHVSGLIRPPFHAKKDWTYEGESFELVEKKLVLPFGFWRYASNMVIIAACTPLVLVGLLSEIPFLLVKHFVLKRFKDPQFHIAISWFLKHIWVSSLFVLGLVYWIYDGLFSFKGFMIAAILLGHLVLPLCKRSIRKIISQLRYLMLPQELKIRVDRIYQSE